MPWTILAGANLIFGLLAYCLLACVLARFCWRRRGIFAVLLGIFVAGQIWLAPQCIHSLVFGRHTLLFWIWFGDWLVTGFGIIFLWKTLHKIPPDRANAARMEGCGTIGIGWHVVLPLVGPSLLLLAPLLLMAALGDLCARGLLDVQGRSLYLVTNWRLLLVTYAIVNFALIAIFFLAQRLFPLPSSAKAH